MSKYEMAMDDSIRAYHAVAVGVLGENLSAWRDALTEAIQRVAEFARNCRCVMVWKSARRQKQVEIRAKLYKRHSRGLRTGRRRECTL